ncbi:MAG: DUF1573 domain-containing protein [Bacteroidetes bacterium]|nr:DUF1573 domain-containing protein [Bacteroidota bacterium]
MPIKKISIALLLCGAMFCLIHPLSAQTLSAAVAFEERVYDFGAVPEKNGKVSHTFFFRNNGKTPIVISGVHSSCGCIDNSPLQEPVKPGGKGKITITFNPDYKSGFFSKEILVYSNNGREYSHIWVQGTVIPKEHPIEDDYPYAFGNGLYLRLKVMAFGYLKPGETRQMELHYANSTQQPMVVDFGKGDGKNGLRFNNPGKIGPGARGVVVFSYTLAANAKDDAILVLHPTVNGKVLKETLTVKVLNDTPQPPKGGGPAHKGQRRSP